MQAREAMALDFADQAMQILPDGRELRLEKDWDIQPPRYDAYIIVKDSAGTEVDVKLYAGYASLAEAEAVLKGLPGYKRDAWKKGNNFS